MAPVIKWQRWDSASYDWFGQAATDALPGLEAELDAWITAVNGNASNVGRSITKERGYADSTTANYAALVISGGGNGNAAKGYLSFGCYGSTSTKRIFTGDTFTDDTSNGGYGAVSGGGADTNVGWRTSGEEANWLIMYDTADGEEFFVFGPTFNAASTSLDEGFAIVKCSDGEWSLASNDGTSHLHTHYWDDGGAFVGWSNCSRGSAVTATDAPFTQTSYTVSRWGMYPSSSSAASNVDSPSTVYAANSALVQPSSVSSYYYTGYRRVLTTVGDGTNVYVLSGYYYGPALFVDLRP